MTFDNEFGAPFIMTWLDGIPLRNVWPRSASDTRSVARAMGQLCFFHASKVGELHFEPVDDQSLVKDIEDKAFVSIPMP